MKIYKTIIQQYAIPFSPLAASLSVMLCCFVWLSSPGLATAKSNTYEIVVHGGRVEKTIKYFKSKNFWGESTHDKDLDVPRIILAVTSNRWEKESQKVEVKVKKELFYRAIVPMVLFANELILKERQALEEFNENLHKGKTLSAKEMSRLQSIAKKYGLKEVDDSKKQVAQLLERVDIIPPSLALGQTAYESGYGTSRFAVEGNALFGQWTYSGDGMKPKQHRESKGNYGVAAYKWPFDSVRSYMHNLNTHNAYQGLRDKRAALRKKGKEVTGLALADTLTSYSEKGAEYVKTLKSIISVNGLEVADNAYLRDEPMTLVVGVDDVKKVGEAESKIEQLRASGELDRIIKSMRLDGEE
ncbi:MAG: glucosaminidase domain-containing protein [Desulfosarcina sp.]|nr:glucosaminidase domain-containing protein [Desulfosarcina sp.]MBC2742980.1 glucosaminidase domain-containing protein [Desulfosarcina sp.]MBC2765890.1 glucosaminidase [Desulfosarcina sp.]